MQGRSLTPRLRGQAAESTGDDPPLAFAEAGWETNNRWQKVVRDRRFKLIFAQSKPEQRWIGGEGVPFALYDLAADPGETENVAGDFPDERQRLEEALWRWESRERFPVELGGIDETCSEERVMEGETRRLLEALGYL